MTSNINYLSINENFPVPGVDNDTQTFRDNFDTIKQSLRAAQEEITDLQRDTAKLNEDNDFANNVITRAVFQNTMYLKQDNGVIDEVVSEESSVPIDYENGNYQTFIIANNDLPMSFQNLPENDNPALPKGVGKMTLELYGDGGEEVNAGSFEVGKRYLISVLGTTDYTLVGAESNTVGIEFVATGVGSGTGKARLFRQIRFIVSNGAEFRKSPNFPATPSGITPLPGLAVVRLVSQDNPIIIEVWRHKGDKIFLNYLGQFS